MSIESAKQFLEKMKNEEEFRKEMGNLKSPEEIIEKANAHGFQFTKDQLENAKGDVLEDSDLDAVAGGFRSPGITINSTFNGPGGLP